MKTKYKILALFGAITSLTGCVSYMPLSPNVEHSIKVIYIKPSEKINDNIVSTIGFSSIPNSVVCTNDDSSGLDHHHSLFSADAKCVKQAIKNIQKKNHFTIQGIVAQAFKQQIAHATNIRFGAYREANAVLTIHISMYGISVPTDFSTQVKPVLGIHAVLTNKQHQVIWANSSFSGAWGSDLPEYSLAKVLTLPKVLKSMWTTLARREVKKLLANF